MEASLCSICQRLDENCKFERKNLPEKKPSPRKSRVITKDKEEMKNAALALTKILKGNLRI